MNSKTAHDDILKKLRENDDRMKRDDLLCSFTSNERPSAHLQVLIEDGITRLIKNGKITLIDGEYLVLPSMPSVSG